MESKLSSNLGNRGGLKSYSILALIGLSLVGIAGAASGYDECPYSDVKGLYLETYKNQIPVDEDEYEADDDLDLLIVGKKNTRYNVDLVQPDGQVWKDLEGGVWTDGCGINFDWFWKFSPDEDPPGKWRIVVSNENEEAFKTINYNPGDRVSDIPR